jgi:3-hydroxybutyryl-CoA dehydrogenase
MAGLPKDSIVGVVGAGVMGTGIAQVAALAGHTVLLHDSRKDAATAARDQLGAWLAKAVDKGKVDAVEREAVLSRVEICDDLQSFSRVDLAIEAIAEDLEAKVALLVALESVVESKAYLATNTSSLSVTAIAAGLQRPEKFGGLHFFNPAPLMSLVEVVEGLATSRETLEIFVETARAWGKTTVTVKDAPGFIVNKGARPFYGEALKFVEEGGADFATTDSLIRSLGFRMGPLELIDLVGLDINLTASRSTWQSYYAEHRFRPSLLVEQRVASGHLGRKSGKGFFDYPSTTEAVPKTMGTCKGPTEVTVHGDIGPASPLFQLSRQAGVEIDRTQGEGWLMLDGLKLALCDGRMAAERGPGWAVFDLALDWNSTTVVSLAAAKETDVSLAAGYFQALGKEVVQVADLPGMLCTKTICMLINEACETVFHGVASKEDVNEAMKRGLNFPGGPFEWADVIGLEYCVRVLDNIARSYGDPRYRASVFMRRMALNGEKFYA